MLDNHSIGETSNVEKRNRNFSTEESLTSPKTTGTVQVIERDLDTNALMQREKVKNMCSNFVTDNRRFRKKSQAKKKEDKYAQDEKKKRSYADVVNGTHVNNINLSYIYLDLLKGEENIPLKLTLLRLTFVPILLKV